MSANTRAAKDEVLGVTAPTWVNRREVGGAAVSLSLCEIVLRPPKDEQADQDDDRPRERNDRDERNNKSGARRR